MAWDDLDCTGNLIFKFSMTALSICGYPVRKNIDFGEVSNAIENKRQSMEEKNFKLIIFMQNF